MYFYCTYSIKTKILSMLGTGYFLKSQKLIPSKKNQSVLIAKISSRKTGEGPNLVQKGLLNFLVANYFSPTSPPTSYWEGRDDYVFLNPWKPVAGGAGNTPCDRRRTDHRRVPKDNQIFEYPWNLIYWQNTTRVSLKNSASQTVIYNPIVVRILVSNQYEIWWGGGVGSPDPRDPPPGSATALVPFDILSTAFGNSNTPIAS